MIIIGECWLYTFKQVSSSFFQCYFQNVNRYLGIVVFGIQKYTEFSELKEWGSSSGTAKPESKGICIKATSGFRGVNDL